MFKDQIGLDQRANNPYLPQTVHTAAHVRDYDDEQVFLKITRKAYDDPDSFVATRTLMYEAQIYEFLQTKEICKNVVAEYKGCIPSIESEYSPFKLYNAYKVPSINLGGTLEKQSTDKQNAFVNFNFTTNQAAPIATKVGHTFKRHEAELIVYECKVTGNSASAEAGNLNLTSAKIEAMKFIENYAAMFKAEGKTLTMREAEKGSLYRIDWDGLVEKENFQKPADIYSKSQQMSAVFKNDFARIPYMIYTERIDGLSLLSDRASIKEVETVEQIKKMKNMENDTWMFVDTRELIRRPFSGKDNVVYTYTANANPEGFSTEVEAIAAAEDRSKDTDQQLLEKLNSFSASAVTEENSENTPQETNVQSETSTDERAPVPVQQWEEINVIEHLFRYFKSIVKTNEKKRDIHLADGKTEQDTFFTWIIPETVELPEMLIPTKIKGRKSAPRNAGERTWKIFPAQKKKNNEWVSVGQKEENLESRLKTPLDEIVGVEYRDYSSMTTAFLNLFGLLEIRSKGDSSSDDESGAETHSVEENDNMDYIRQVSRHWKLVKIEKGCEVFTFKIINKSNDERPVEIKVFGPWKSALACWVAQLCDSYAGVVNPTNDWVVVTSSDTVKDMETSYLLYDNNQVGSNFVGERSSTIAAGFLDIIPSSTGGDVSGITIPRVLSVSSQGQLQIDHNRVEELLRSQTPTISIGEHEFDHTTDINVWELSLDTNSDAPACRVSAVNPFEAENKILATIIAPLPEIKQYYTDYLRKIYPTCEVTFEQIEQRHFIMGRVNRIVNRVNASRKVPDNDQKHTVSRLRHASESFNLSASFSQQSSTGKTSSPNQHKLLFVIPPEENDKGDDDITYVFDAPYRDDKGLQFTRETISHEEKENTIKIEIDFQQSVEKPYFMSVSWKHDGGTDDLKERLSKAYIGLKENTRTHSYIGAPEPFTQFKIDAAKLTRMVGPEYSNVPLYQNILVKNDVSVLGPTTSGNGFFYETLPRSSVAYILPSAYSVLAVKNYTRLTLYKWLEQQQNVDQKLVAGVLFQVLYAIRLLNVDARIQHNDLHFGNIFLSTNDTDITYDMSQLDTEMFVKKYGNDLKSLKIKAGIPKPLIFDFDRAFCVNIGNNPKLDFHQPFQTTYGQVNRVNNVTDVIGFWQQVSVYCTDTIKALADEMLNSYNSFIENGEKTCTVRPFDKQMPHVWAINEDDETAKALETELARQHYGNRLTNHNIVIACRALHSIYDMEPK